MWTIYRQWADFCEYIYCGSDARCAGMWLYAFRNDAAVFCHRERSIAAV